MHPHMSDRGHAPRLRLWSVLVLLGAVSLTMSCSGDGERDGIAGASLADGRVVGDLLEPSTTSVVLVYSASDCFTCGGILGRWARFGREHDTAVKLVLTGEPTPREAAGLAFLRMDVAGVLEDELPEGGSPAAYRFVGTDLDRSAVGLLAQSDLLDELARPMGGVAASQSSGR